MPAYWSGTGPGRRQAAGTAHIGTDEMQAPRSENPNMGHPQRQTPTPAPLANDAKSALRTSG